MRAFRCSEREPAGGRGDSTPLLSEGGCDERDRLPHRRRALRGAWLRRRQIARLLRRDVKTIGRHLGNALREELSGRRGPSCRIFCDSCPRRRFLDRDGALLAERGTGASGKQLDAPPLSSAGMPGPEAGTARALPGKEMRARPPEQSGPLKPCGFAIRTELSQSQAVRQGCAGCRLSLAGCGYWARAPCEQHSKQRHNGRIPRAICALRRLLELRPARPDRRLPGRLRPHPGCRASSRRPCSKGAAAPPAGAAR